MKWLFMAILLIVFALPIHAEMIEVPKEELMEYLARMEKDRETIRDLQEANVELQLRIQACQIQINSSQRLSDEQIGIYIGGNVSYPLGANAIIMYKFPKWGLYMIGGYNNGFDIGMGAVFKMR